MPRSWKRTGPWSTATAVAMFAVVIPASAAPVPAKPAGESVVAKARAALEKPVTAKADAKSFVEAVDLLKEVTKAEIILDTGVIQMMGMDVNTPMVKFEAKDAKLKDVLKSAFGPFNLRCGITASGLVLSTDEGIIARQLRERVSLDADGKPLADVLKRLAEETGANVVIDPRAKKMAEEKVTLTLDDVPLEAAVRLAAEMGGASVVRMSNVLFVTTEARADKLRPDADRPVGPSPANPFFPGIDGGPGGIGAPGGIGGAIPPVQAVPAVIPPDAPVRKEEKKER